MKRCVVLLALCAASCSCFAQTKSESYYKNKSVKITTYHLNKLVSNGSGFIIKEADNYYLVTNYHVLTNLKAQDTAIYDAAGHKVSPTTMGISFYNKGQNKTESKSYTLVKNKQRSFYSTAAGDSRSTSDIAFYKLKDISPGTKIDTVDLRQTGNENSIDKKSKLFMYGSSLVKIDYEATLSLFGQITGKETHPITGCSGAPVFAFTNGKKSFVGMASATKINTDGKKSFVVIAKSSIRSSFAGWSGK